MEVRPFQMKDYVSARLINGISLEQWDLEIGVVETLKYMERCKTFWTLWVDDTVVFIAGWHQNWPGVCEVSLFPTEYLRAKPIGAVLRLKKELRKLKKNCQRIQLTCRKEKLFMQFAKRLGFKVEGTLRNFGPGGRDHIMMAIVEENHA